MRKNSYPYPSRGLGILKDENYNLGMRKFIGVFLGVSLLLAACDGGTKTPAVEPPTATDPAKAVPTPPVLGQSLELQNAPAAMQAAAQSAMTLVSPNNPDIDENVQYLLNLSGMQGLSIGGKGLQASAATGRALLGQVAQSLPHQNALGAQAIQTNPLQHGTYHIDANRRMIKDSDQPSTGMIVTDAAHKLTLNVDWRVGGAATTTVNWFAGSCDMNGCTPSNTEIPTKASATLLRSGVTVAQMNFSMAEGNCLSQTGPDSLSLSSWVGSAAKPASSLSLDYAWDSSSLRLSAEGSYSTKRETGSSSFKLAVLGNTTNRCDLRSLSFTPTQLDLTASAKVPNHSANLAVYLRDLKNLTLSEAGLRATTWYKDVSGSLNANLNYNGQTVVTATGPLTDGPDLDLYPGDQIVTTYIKDGKLVTSDLAGLLAALKP